MSAFQFIEVKTENQAARLILARGKHNVLNIPMIREINGRLASFAKDNDLKCLVISGRGNSFSAGVEVGDHKPEKAEEMMRVFNRMFELIHSLDIPVIASVGGFCLGGGMELAIACDMVVASESAVFGQPEVKLGFFPPYAALRLPALVGEARAIEILTTGKKYTAREGQALGFVSRVAPGDHPGEEAERFVDEILVSSPLILKMNKRAVKWNMGRDFSGGVRQVTDYFLNTLMKTHDTLEGIQGFEEKRSPDWKNR